MTKKTSSTYSQEFKDTAVALIQTSDKSLSQIARELGIAVSTLIGWRDAAQSDKKTSGDEEFSRLKAEYAELKKANAKLQEENAILKKASAYFAQQMK